MFHTLLRRASKGVWARTNANNIVTIAMVGVPIAAAMCNEPASTEITARANWQALKVATN